MRDTLSLLDQLMAGSEGDTVEYERAVALLGYTHGALLDEVVDAIGARDAGAVFGAVDRVIQTGQDPRRFVEDLLERLRDLIIVAATSGNAQAVLRGIPQDQLDRMIQQSSKFGPAELSRAADVVNSALSEMTGATSPRLHLELMVARILVPASDDTQRGALARVERLERRVGVEGGGATSSSTVAPPAAEARTEPQKRVEPQAPAEPQAPVESSSAPEPTSVSEPAASAPEPAAAGPAKPVVAGDISLDQFKNAWPQVLEVVQKAKMSAWTVVYTSQVRALEGDVLTLTFVSQNDVDSFKQQQQGPGDSVSEYLRKAIVEVLGLRVKFIARAENPAPEPVVAAPSAPETDASGWAVAAIPESEPTTPAPRAPRPKAEPAAPKEPARYGESVVRELLGASFIEEEQVAPRVVPRPADD